MFHLILLLPLVTSDPFIWNHLNNQLNETVDVCQDFYNHVCSRVVHDPTQQFIYHRKIIIEKLIENYMPENFNDALGMVKENNSVEYDDEVEFVEKFFEQCISGSQRSDYAYDVIFSVLGFVFNKEITIEANCLQQLSIFSQFFFPEQQKIVRQSVDLLNSLARTEAFTEMRRHVSLEIAEKNMRSLFELVRASLINTIQSSKSLEKNHLAPVLLKRISQTTMTELKVLDSYRSKLSGALDELPKCLESFDFSSSGRPSQVTVSMCMVYSILSQFETTTEGFSLLNLLRRDPLEFNAFYSNQTNSVYISPTLHELDNWDNLTQLATVGTIIAHELSHGIFTIEGTIKQCLAETMAQGCSIFHNEKVCRSGIATTSEDGPDMSATQTILDLIERETTNSSMLDITNAHLNRNFTARQFYFHAHTTVYCHEYRDHVMTEDKKPGAHSPLPIRINAIFRHFDEFEKEFGCTANDKMVLAKEDECHLTGPLSKKSRNT